MHLLAMNAGDIYEGSYTATQLQALIMGGGVKFYTKDATGAEIKDVVRCLVEGCGRDDDPISWDTAAGIKRIYNENIKR